jgi:hypothetical protein
MDSNTGTPTPNPEIDKGSEKLFEGTSTCAVSAKNEQDMTAEMMGKQNERLVVDKNTYDPASVSDEAIGASDVEKRKLLEENVQLQDQIKLLRNEIQRLEKLELDDTWLDSWDAQIFRCTDCDRPFGTRTRLLDHRKTWHSAGSGDKEKYAKAGSNLKPAGITELKKIFEGGDLILKTSQRGGRTVGYLVSSQVLCMTSKVFLKMLGRDSLFKEAMDVRRANVLGFQPAVVTVDDDDKALEFILQFIHHRHDMLPAALVFPELVRIAEICDKYELQLALKPTVDKFLEPHKKNLTGSLYRDWLLVSHVFGYADIFSKISKELILTGSWTGNSLLFSDGASIPLSSCTPSSVTGTHHLAPTTASFLCDLRKEN